MLVVAPPGTLDASMGTLMWVVTPLCIKYKKFDCLSNHCKMAYNFYPILVVKN